MWSQVDTDQGVDEANEGNNILGPQKLDVNEPGAPTALPISTFTPTSTPPAVNTPVPTPTKTPAKPCGDANSDGSVNSTDSALVLQEVAGLTNVPNPDSADVNGDGSVNTLDSLLILQHVAGLLPVLTC